MHDQVKHNKDKLKMDDYLSTLMDRAIKYLYKIFIYLYKYLYKNIFIIFFLV